MPSLSTLLNAALSLIFVSLDFMPDEIYLKNVTFSSGEEKGGDRIFGSSVFGSRISTFIDTYGFYNADDEIGCCPRKICHQLHHIRSIIM